MVLASRTPCAPGGFAGGRESDRFAALSYNEGWMLGAEPLMPASSRHLAAVSPGTMGAGRRLGQGLAE